MDSLQQALGSRSPFDTADTHRLVRSAAVTVPNLPALPKFCSSALLSCDMGTQLAPKQHKSPQSPAGSASQADELITSATQKRKRGRLQHDRTRCTSRRPRIWRETLAPRLAGVDPALVSPTVKRNCRVEVGAPYNPRSLAKIFLGNGQVHP